MGYKINIGYVGKGYYGGTNELEIMKNKTGNLRDILVFKNVRENKL